MAKKEITTVKRFGPRYGRRIRHKLAKIEAESKKSHKCPYCSREKVKRLAVGIWECGKCKSKFTGRAYTPGKRRISEEGVEEVEKAEEKEE